MSYLDLDGMVMRWWPMVRSIAREFPMPGMTVEDVEQEGLIALLEAARRFDSKRGVSFPTFAHHVVTLRLRDVAVKARRKKHTPLNESATRATRYGEEEPLLDLLADPAPQPDVVVIARERLNEIIRIVKEELTQAERTALGGYLNDRSYAEIALELHVAGGLRYVDNALQRGRRKLRAA